MKATDRFKYCPVCNVKFYNPYGMCISRWNQQVCCSRKCRDEHFKGHPQYNTGKTHFKKGHKLCVGRVASEETKKKLSISHMGQIPKNKGVYARNSPATEFRIGHTPWNYNGGVNKVNSAYRKTQAYKTWRKDVFIRDRYTCQICGKHGGELHADHIKPFAFFPELRLELTNGRTLCAPCHKNTDTYGYKAFEYAKKVC